MTLFSYDGDENTADSKPHLAATIESFAPVSASAEAKEEPGYGEEPDTAAPPDSFDDYAGNNEDIKEEAATPMNGGDFDRARNTFAAGARDEPLQMKEDG